MNNFSRPRRMSASAFLIIFIINVRKLLSYVIILTLIELFKSRNVGDKLTNILFILGGEVLLALVLSLLTYFTQKFSVKDGNLIFQRGLIAHDTVTIPLTKIHALRTNSGVWYRILGVRGIAIDTLASRFEEIELILDEADWQQLIKEIESQEKQPVAADAVEPPPFNPESTVKFSNLNLLRDALCQNHLKGAAILLGFLWMIYSEVSDVIDDAAERLANKAADFYEEANLSALDIAGLAAAGYLFVLLLWLGKAFLLYSNMTLSYNNRKLAFSYGLVSRRSSRFIFDKVCTIWVKRNFFERRFNLSTIKLCQALNATAREEDDNLKIYGADHSNLLLSWWLGKGYADAPDIITAKSGRGLYLHSVFPGVIISGAATLILCYYHQYLWTVLPGIYLISYLCRGVATVRHSRITLKESYLIVHNGRFADIRNYIKYADIQVVQIKRTPFTRWFHRVALTLSTPGSTFTVRSLKLEEATLIYELLLTARAARG